MKDHTAQWMHTGLTYRDVAERATDYLEDQLPTLTTSRIGLHVASCGGCRSYVMQIGLVSSALRSLPKFYPAPTNRLHLRRQFAAHHSQSTSGT